MRKFTTTPSPSNLLRTGPTPFFPMILLFFPTSSFGRHVTRLKCWAESHAISGCGSYEFESITSFLDNYWQMSTTMPPYRVLFGCHQFIRVNCFIDMWTNTVLCINRWSIHSKFWEKYTNSAEKAYYSIGNMKYPYMCADYSLVASCIAGIHDTSHGNSRYVSWESTIHVMGIHDTCHGNPRYMSWESMIHVMGIHMSHRNTWHVSWEYIICLTGIHMCHGIHDMCYGNPRYVMGIHMYHKNHDMHHGNYDMHHGNHNMCHGNHNMCHGNLRFLSLESIAWYMAWKSMIGVMGIHNTWHGSHDMCHGNQWYMSWESTIRVIGIMICVMGIHDTCHENPRYVS